MKEDVTAGIKQIRLYHAEGRSPLSLGGKEKIICIDGQDEESGERIQKTAREDFQETEDLTTKHTKYSKRGTKQKKPGKRLYHAEAPVKPANPPEAERDLTRIDMMEQDKAPGA